MLVLPIVGVGCLLFPDVAEEVLPYFLGVPMVLSGVGSIVAVARERDVEAGATSVGAAIVLVVLGVLLMEEKSWAALGALAAKGICFLAGCVVMIGKHN